MRPLSRTADAASNDEALADEIEALTAMSLGELRGYWASRWREPAPSYRAKDQISRAIAYRLQVEAFGGLPRTAKRQLAEFATRFETDRGFTPGPNVVLKPGSALIREWGGLRHEVAVVVGGFLYDGERFASLSKLAHRITGVKWNGPVFFGVKARKVPAAQGRHLTR
jgi:hypothetical protein